MSPSRTTAGDTPGQPSAADHSLLRVPKTAVSRPTFARHDTFHPRFGWLKKGYDAAVQDPTVFSREDAPVVLGVGKNMVRAIKHWCLATGVLEDDEVSGRAFHATPTTLGKLLLGSDGLDQYLEDLGSLWILHWRLVGNADLATGWWYAFFRFPQTEFLTEDLAKAIEAFVGREFASSRFAYSSYKKDATCLARMYGELPTGFTGEESIQCPFAELALIRPIDRRHYSFQIGTKPGLSDEIIAFATAEFALSRGNRTRTVPLSALVQEPGAPGLAFRLGESQLYAALERVSNQEDMKLSDSGGLIHLIFSADPSETAKRMLRRHYSVRSAVAI